jgi:hypothetical protein
MKTKTTFRSCGLNKNHYQLQAQICPCGCGHYANLVLKNDKDVADFIGAMLYELECKHCAIFAIKQDGNLIFGQKTDEDIMCYHLKTDNAKKEIADMQKTCKFHCYGLLEQVDDELYAIIMD